MSARFQSHPMVEMLASSAGAIPLGPQLPPRARQQPRIHSAAGGAFAASTTAPIRVQPRTQDDVVKLVSLACGQGASVRAGDWTLGLPGSEPADAVLLDLSRLDRVTGLADGGIWAEAGTVLAQVNRACRRHQQHLHVHLRERRETIGRDAARAVHNARHFANWDDLNWLTRIKLVSVEPTPRILRLRFAETVDWLERTGLRAVVLEVQAQLVAGEIPASTRPAQLREPAFSDTLPGQFVS